MEGIGLMKDAYYFSHDSNARHDPKIIALRSVYKLEGYGWYWVIVEMLRESKDYELNIKDKNTLSAIAFELNTTRDVAEKFIKDCIEEFELFVSDGESIRSASLCKRMERLDEKKRKRSEAGKKGAAEKWQKDDKSPKTDSNAKEIDSNAIGNNSKVNKVNKVNKEININSPDGRKPEPKPDYILQLIEIFSEEYEKNRGFAFELINIGKERKAIGKLLSTYKEKNKASPKTSEETKQDFRIYFKACLTIPDTWLRENMSPSLIVNKFNEIKTLLRKKQNGSSNTKNGATVEGILTAIAKNFESGTASAN